MRVGGRRVGNKGRAGSGGRAGAGASDGNSGGGL